MSNIERAVEAGAAALVKGGVVRDRVTGDVLHDHDWTPMEAAKVVLEAANYAGAVAAERERIVQRLREMASTEPKGSEARLVLRVAADAIAAGGQ